jgi:hypothetical protein
MLIKRRYFKTVLISLTLFMLCFLNLSGAALSKNIKVFENQKIINLTNQRLTNYIWEKGDNVAKDGKIEYCQGCDDGNHPAEFVIDGNRNTFATMNTEKGLAHQDSYIIINLTKKYVLHSMWFRASHQANSMEGKIEISISTDNKSWIKVWEHKLGSNSLLTPYEWDISSCLGDVAMYVRIYGFYTGGDFPSNLYRAYELEVYNVVDKSEPDTTITAGPRDGDVLTGKTVTFTFEWEGNDDITPAEELLYSYRLRSEGRNAPWSEWTSSTKKTYKDLHPTNGKLIFEVKAKDLSGNEDSTPAKREFFVYDEEPKITVNIDRPKNYLYIFDREIIPTVKPIVVGSITIECTALSDVSEIKKVEFYVNNELKYVDYYDETNGFSWKWVEQAFGTYRLKVVAYDKLGRTAEEQLEITKYF